MKPLGSLEADPRRREILCIGEVLWDVFPSGRFLGGAPFNVACHLHALGRNVALASRVGNDEPGREIFRDCAHRGISTDLIQTDPVLPTGLVIVTLAKAHTPHYEIVMPSAWDAIEAEPDLLTRASAAAVIVFGTLAQRDEWSRRTISALLETKAMRVLDINLRHPFDSREVVEQSLRRADLAKLNDEELERLRNWFDLPSGDEAAAGALAQRFGCHTICVTRGQHGAALWHDGNWAEHPGYSGEIVDAVGAGDAFLAGLLTQIAGGRTGVEALRYANAVGFHVATQRGATPHLDRQAINDLAQTLPDTSLDAVARV